MWFSAILHSTSIDLALTCIGKELDMNIIALSWIITAYFIATAVLVVPFGRLALEKLKYLLTFFLNV